MRIYRLFGFFLLIFLLSCSRQDKVVIVGKIHNADGTISTLKELRLTSTLVIDSVNIKKNGNFRYIVPLHNPGYYQLNFDEGKFLALILSPGEKIRINADLNNFYESKSISGSDNTVRINELHDSLRSTISKLKVIGREYEEVAIHDSLNAEKKDSLETLYTKIRKDHHQYSTRFILEDFSSLANIAALYQEYSSGDYVFNSQRDIQFFKLASDSLSKYYPKVRQVKTLKENYESMILRYQQAKLLQSVKVEERDLPDLSLPDRKGKSVTLSSQKGKVVLLAFWSVNQEESITNIIELKKIYNKYSKENFEIYQVCIDQDLNKWNSAVKFEDISWISVIDTAFHLSATRGLFNVTEIPMNYLINAEQSDIIGKNLSSVTLDRTLLNLFNK